jgi:transcriptional regulator with GAF, ATPase, and Fis domain
MQSEARRTSRRWRVSHWRHAGAPDRRNRFGKGSSRGLDSRPARRGHRAFVPINCAAIPNELMEAELFGYARGAFSGAIQRYDGQLAAGAGGTVFLDEIHDTPQTTQVKLLRVLEDRVVSRLGENVWHEVDFRLLAATNRDLRAH